MMERLKELLRLARTPLYANANALVANQVISAGLGLVYWAVAGRTYATAVYGASTAIISTLQLISGVAQIGLGGGMTRFLPRAGNRTRRLILVTYAAVIATSVVLSVAFVAFGGALGLRSVLGNGPLVAFWVISASAAWSIFRLQDAVLIGLRQAKWVLIENTIYNALKLLLVVVGVRLLAEKGIVGSWFLPTPIVIALCTWLIFGVYTRTARVAPAPDDIEPLTIREVVTTSGGDHVGSLLSEASTRVLPLLVVGILGATANAYFYTSWLIATTLGLLAGSMTDSFTAEAAADRANIGRHSRAILRYMALLIIPAAAVLGFGAPLILSIWGRLFDAEGTTLLRWLCLSSPLILFDNWYFAYARVIGHIRQVVWLQGLGAVVLLGLTLVLLDPLGVSGVGVAWLVSQAVVAVAGLIDSRTVFFGGNSTEGGAPA